VSSRGFRNIIGFLLQREDFEQRLVLALVRVGPVWVRHLRVRGHGVTVRVSGFMAASW